MHVKVLLSTFNGEEYIAEQIESILNQDYKDLSLLIRDDGSLDNTVEKIQYFTLKYPERVKLIKGHNIGVINSFRFLLEEAENGHSFYSFCDQDDVWLPHKVETAVNTLNKQVETEPLMHFTSTYLTDSKLGVIKVWPSPPTKNLFFYNALIENIAVGTTITINKVAREMLLTKNPVEKNIIMHDWWFYLCISALGEVIYDPSPSVLYRQHERNLIGGNKSLRDLILRKYRSFSSNKGSRILYHQALEFWKCYENEVKGDVKEQLKLFLEPRNNILKRLIYLKKSRLHRQGIIENVWFKFLVVIGYI
ncbi:glycosyltransferase family 2 protein [Paenibacillus sp. FSL R7-0204]|uniref:glycosyltransferase family 2 protein n=1 Tax=Paenibacillus sp. FSL R7-0204 TaxID=2921675 RepID=UPI0030F718A8